VDWVFKDTLLDGRQKTKPAQSVKSLITTPHLKPKAVLTYQERAFFWVLLRAIAAEYSVLAKVHVADFIEMSDELKAQKSYGEQILFEHVDFLLCKKSTFEPILVIELDNGDASPAHVESNGFKVETLTAAGIAYLLIPIQKEYNSADLKQQIHEKLGETPKPTSSYHWYG
jgi:hypothetical protein